MYRILIGIILLLCTSERGVSQILDLTFVDNNSPKPLTLTMGFRSGATLGIDTAFGEKELPPFQPVGTGHAVLVMDLDKSRTYSSSIDLYAYKDIRSMEPINIADTFWIALSPWTQDRKQMEFTWNWPLDNGLDSIVITDKGGMAFKKTLNSSKSIIIKPNDLGVGTITIENYYVIMYRSKSVNSIEREASNDEYFNVYSLLGHCVLSHVKYDDILVKLQEMQNGLYILQSPTQILKIKNF
jgi:hypothetical protein